MTRLAPHPEPCLCPRLHATFSGRTDIPASSVGHQAKGCVFASNRQKIWVRDPWEKSFRRAGGDGWGSLRGRDDHQSLNEMITRAGSGPGRDWPSPRRARASFSFARGQASGHHLGPVSGFPGVHSPSSPPVFRRDLEELPPSGGWGARTVTACSALSQFMKHFTDVISFC